MKWFKAILCIAFLATVMAVPTGCTKSGITEQKGTGEKPPVPAGHAAAAQGMNKPPAAEK